MSSTVNVPTNQKIKEKDINAKLQLFGIYSAFAQGKVPSNKQIDVAMNSALEWRGLSTPNKKLSADGQKLVADLRDVIEKAKVLLLTKNDGNLLQDFIWQTQHVGSGDATKPNAPIQKDQAKQHGQEALEGLRTLGELLITNGQFRKLLSDASILLRDIAGDAAQKAANKVNPSEDQLNQIDQPAEDNTWHDKPDFQGYKQKVQDRLPSKEQAKKEAKDAAGDVSQSSHPQGLRDPAHPDAPSYESQQAAGERQDPNASAKQGAQAGKENVKNKIGGRFTEDEKQRMKEYRERTNNYFKNKVPKERREQLVFRLKKMVVEVQTHQDYQQAIETLLRLAEEYAGHTKSVGQQTTGSAKGAYEQGPVKKAETDLKELLERFANGTSFDDLFDAINQIYRDADKDPELKNWFKDLDKFIRRCLQEQGYIIEDQSNEEWNRLYDKGHFLLRERYRNHTDRILDEVKFLAGEFDKDPQNKAFADSMNRLFQDLGNDEDGKPQFKPHLLKDLTDVLIPSFFEHIRYVPLPRTEYSDKMIDLVVENVVLEGDNLAPNIFEFGSDNYFRWGRKGAQNKNKNKVMLSVSGIQMDIRDIAYYVKKKEGFPSITDKGVMDVFLGGSGLSFKVAMETADKSDKQHFFKINTITVDIQNMNIKVKQSNHKLLFAIAKPIMLKVLRPVIQKVVEKQIRDQVTQLDAMCYRVKQEADRAAEEAKANPDPDNIQNMYQRYFNAYQREVAKGKQKKDEAAADKKVNVAMTQQDSIFKNISLPGGISTKATEYKQLADKGDRWESPVFSIGSARESGLPTPGKPQRKPHSATQAAVRDHPGQTSGTTTSGNTSSGLTDRAKGEYQTGAPFQTSGIQNGSTTTDSMTNPTTGGTYQNYQGGSLY